MPEKQKTSNWKGIHTIIAAISMALLLFVCNLIASFDSREVKVKTDGSTLSITTNTPPPQNIFAYPQARVMSARVAVTRTSSS